MNLFNCTTASARRMFRAPLVSLIVVVGSASVCDATPPQLQTRFASTLTMFGEDPQVVVGHREATTLRTANSAVFDLTTIARSGDFEIEWSESVGTLRAFRNWRLTERTEPTGPSNSTRVSDALVGPGYQVQSSPEPVETQHDSHAQTRPRRCEELLGSLIAEDVSGHTRLTEKQALIVATAWGARMGLSLDDTLDLRPAVHHGESRRWLFTWWRTVDGYSFPDEHVFFAITDVEGEVSYYENTLTDREIDLTRSVSSEHAMRVAQAHADRLLADKKMHTSYRAETMVLGSQIAYTNVNAEPDSLEALTLVTKPQFVYVAVISFEYVGGAPFHSIFPSIRLWVSGTDGSILLER